MPLLFGPSSLGLGEHPLVKHASRRLWGGLLDGSRCLQQLSRYLQAQEEIFPFPGHTLLAQQGTWKRYPSTVLPVCLFLLSFCTPQIFALLTGFFFLSSLQRMQKRAERFNVPVSLESKKAARAAR